MTAQTPQRQRYSPFDSNSDTVKPIGWTPILVFALVEMGFLYVVNVIVFPSQVWRPVFEMTGGLVSPTLVANLAGIVIVVVGVILVFGGLKKEDIGLRWSLMPRAAVIVLLAWLATQVAGAVISFIVTGRVSLDASWSRYGISAMVGLLLGQLFGNSFLEEVAFRGFLLPQLYFKVAGPRFSGHKWKRLVIALLASQAFFVLMHIPNRLGQGLTPVEWIVDFASVFVIGMIFALIYLRTGNLFIAIGVHALVDAPESLFISADISKWFYVLFGILVVVLWPTMKRIGLPRKKDSGVPDAGHENPEARTDG